MMANWMKTKVMRIARKPEECRIEVNGERVEQDGGDDVPWCGRRAEDPREF